LLNTLSRKDLGQEMGNAEVYKNIFSTNSSLQTNQSTGLPGFLSGKIAKKNLAR
jgi:hypothetical protein